MIIHQRIIAVIALFVSLLLITLDFYYSEKTNQKDYEIKSDHQKPLEIRVRHIDVDKTLEWIFDKSEQNTTKIRKMLLENFPIKIA